MTVTFLLGYARLLMIVPLVRQNRRSLEMELAVVVQNARRVNNALVAHPPRPSPAGPLWLIYAKSLVVTARQKGTSPSRQNQQDQQETQFSAFRFHGKYYDLFGCVQASGTHGGKVSSIMGRLRPG